MKALLLAIACCTLLTACKKNKVKNANELVGVWELTATHRIGQINWEPIHQTEASTLTFNNDYTYSVKPPLISSFSGCTGTYRITNSNTVMMAAACPLTPAFEEEFGFTVTGNTLILDHRTTSTGVKTKYTRK